MTRDRQTSPPRVYVPELAEHRDSSEEKAKEILLGKEERSHVRSRRLRDGDEVVALDGKGARAPALLLRGGTAVALLPSEQAFSSSSSLPLMGEPANRVTVLLACAEPARVEWAIEKGTECGAAGFILLACERSQKSHVAALSSPARLARLQRIAVEATKQCDRTMVPMVEGPKGIEDLLGKGRGERSIFVADPSGSSLSGGREADIAIGPEGGFSAPELSLFKANSSFFFSLGPRILRLETAVVVALARMVEPG
jgi:16S rRNA (uracil1498-N3)-methyltransferase